MSRGRLLDRRPEPVRQNPSERKDVPATASIGSNDAPLIGERAATRGRVATERSGEHARAKARYPFGLASRTVSSCNALLIGERPAARGRVATEGGDEPPGEPNTIRPSAFSGLPLGQTGAPPSRHDELRWQSSTRHRWLRPGRWRQAQLNSTSKEPAKKSSPGGLAQVPPCVQKKKFG
jgi:hypothetical protein